MDWIVTYQVNGKEYTRTVFCFQYGEAYNYTVEDVSKAQGVNPQDVKIISIKKKGA